MATIVLWIDANVDDEENSSYANELELIGSLRVSKFKNIENALEQLKKIEFQETKIIISGSLYSELIKIFKENILDMYIAPKIIVFTKDKENFIQVNKDYQNNKNEFFTFGGIATTFEEIKEFLINDKFKEIKKQDDVQLTFEYIDQKEKLILPIFFKSLIDTISKENMEAYTYELYETYKETKEIKDLLGPIISMKNVPIEILSRYYSRLFTCESDFHKNINKDLGLNKKEKYLPFIKILYEGVKLKALPLASESLLYRGAKISIEEINKIKDYLNNKKEGLPSSIVFSKSFLSFSKSKGVAEEYLNIENTNQDLLKILFILEKDDNIGYNLSTHGDIERLSFFPTEREVLFFPFSSFEIKNLKEIQKGKEKIYEIRLLYLGKYINEIIRDKNLTNTEKEIPNTEFKKQMEEFGLIKKNIIEKINTRKIYKEYKKYENEIKNNNNIEVSVIKAEINIKPDYVGKNIQIINSYENIKKIKQTLVRVRNDDDLKYKNENDIKENIEIKIDGKIIEFSYVYQFEKEGNYKIEYSIKNNLININHLFYACKNLIKLDFTNFDTKQVTNMSSLFQNCGSLTNLDLTNFKTKNVFNMSYMFSGCKLLTKIILTNFNTQNVTDMSYMFQGCESLKTVDLSNFNTEKVIDMSSIFQNCKSLKTIDLSHFNTKNVNNMNYFFQNCDSLTNINLSNFITTNVNDMSYMFGYCKSLKSLDISNFNTQNVIKMGFMFYGCNALKKKNIISKDDKILNLIK